MGKVRILYGHRFICFGPGRWWCHKTGHALTLHGSEWRLWRKVEKTNRNHANFYFFDETQLPTPMRLTSYVRLRCGKTMKDAAYGLIDA